MSTFVGRVGQPYSDNYIYRYNLNESSYVPPTQYVSDTWPRILPYSGWASYKNVKSGLYNRPICTPCVHQKGFMQAPGTFPINYDNRPSAPPFGLSRQERNFQNDVYANYQDRRMSLHPNSYYGYSNYFNTDCASAYPKRYIKGSWPDEQITENILPYTLRDSINPM